MAGRHENVTPAPVPTCEHLTPAVPPDVDHRSSITRPLAQASADTFVMSLVLDLHDDVLSPAASAPSRRPETRWGSRTRRVASVGTLVRPARCSSRAGACRGAASEAQQDATHFAACERTAICWCLTSAIRWCADPSYVDDRRAPGTALQATQQRSRVAGPERGWRRWTLRIGESSGVELEACAPTRPGAVCSAARLRPARGRGMRSRAALPGRRSCVGGSDRPTPTGPRDGTPSPRIVGSDLTAVGIGHLHGRGDVMGPAACDGF
jgi:hypothetical protein